MNKCLSCNNDAVNKFCCRSCSASYNNKKYPKRKPEHSCFTCNKPITARKRYCSIKCKPLPKVLDKQKLARNVVSWRQRTKRRAIEYKGGRCLICGYNKCIRSLAFHHTNPKQKDFAISGVSKSWESVRLELDKCVLLCHNCHGEIHEGLVELPAQRVGVEPTCLSTSG